MMFQTINKIGYQLKKAIIFIGLFLTLFIAGFFLANLDWNSFFNDSANEAPLQKQQVDEAIKEKIGSREIGFVDFKQWVNLHNLSGDNVYDADPDGDGIPNYLEFVHFTDPNDADTDDDGYTDKQEISYGYDPTFPGDTKFIVEVSISKIGVDAPMVWSKTEVEKDMLKDLEKGLSHFPQTAAPGQKGNAVISGHSSNYIWAKGDYNYVFKKLGELEKGDDVTVKVIQKNGRIIIYRYLITEKFVTYPDDARIFEETDKSILTLSTCWPLGTNFKRMIVKAELVK